MDVTFGCRTMKFLVSVPCGEAAHSRYREIFFGEALGLGRIACGSRDRPNLIKHLMKYGRLPFGTKKRFIIV